MVTGHLGQKNEKVRHFVRKVVLWGAVLVRRFFGSGHWGRGYAGGKISACYLV